MPSPRRKDWAATWQTTRHLARPAIGACLWATASIWAMAFISTTVCHAQPGKSVTKIVGGSVKMFLFSDGTIGGYGDGRDGQLGPPQEAGLNSSGYSTRFQSLPLPAKAVDIAATSRTAYVALEDGRVLAWGWNLDGELGCGECGGALKRGQYWVAQPQVVPGITDAVKVAAAAGKGYAVHRDGTVSTWGQRAHFWRAPGNGTAGQGRETDAKVPGKIPGVNEVVSLSCSAHCLAVTRKGTVWQWGWQMMNKTFSDEPFRPPQEVEGLTDVVDAVATYVAAVLKKDGTVWVWGDNQQAQFGDGKRAGHIGEQFSRTPVRVPGVSSAVALTGGDVGRHFVALLRNGTLQTWGNSDWGQCGTGIYGREQANVMSPPIRDVRRVFAVENNTFALTEDGRLWIWGAASPFSTAWPRMKQAVKPVGLDLETGITGELPPGSPAAPPPAAKPARPVPRGKK